MSSWQNKITLGSSHWNPRKSWQKNQGQKHCEIPSHQIIPSWVRSWPVVAAIWIKMPSVPGILVGFCFDWVGAFLDYGGVGLYSPFLGFCWGLVGGWVGFGCDLIRLMVLVGPFLGFGWFFCWDACDNFVGMIGIKWMQSTHTSIEGTYAQWWKKGTCLSRLCLGFCRCSLGAAWACTGVLLRNMWETPGPKSRKAISKTVWQASERAAVWHFVTSTCSKTSISTLNKCVDMPELHVSFGVWWFDLGLHG